MPRELAASLAGVPPHLGWGWRHFAFALAYRLGYPLVLLEGDHRGPIEQRAEDDAARVHRHRQLRENLGGLSAGLTTALPSPSTPRG
jgi:hypothetical protein